MCVGEVELRIYYAHSRFIASKAKGMRRGIDLSVAQVNRTRYRPRDGGDLGLFVCMFVFVCLFVCLFVCVDQQIVVIATRIRVFGNPCKDYDAVQSWISLSLRFMQSFNCY